MTSFPRSPKVLKGAIVGIDIFNPIASVAIFQYNPEQITRSLDPQYSEAGGGQAEALRLQGPPRETISANLTLDLVDQMEQGDAGPLGAGVAGQLAALEMLVYPKTVLVAANQILLATGTMEVIPPVAPLTLFIYGWKRVVPVKVTSISITETAHDPSLNPIRANVDLSMTVLTYNDLPLTHPGYWAFMAHQVVKEVLATVASVDNIGAALGENVDPLNLEVNMFKDRSRYATQPTREKIAPDGRRIVYVLPRRIPPPEAFQAGLRQPVTDSDRLDLLAYRHLGDPTAFWMIADANRASHPAEVLDEPGSDVVIPTPGTWIPGR